MKTLIVTPDNDRELQFLKELLGKLGYPVQELTQEEAEDGGLLTAMVREKKEDYVSEEEVRQELRKK
jgi:hypothetical protein